MRNAARPGSRSSPKSRSIAHPARSWPRKFTVAHDCGQIINPDGLHHAIENNVVQATSRTLWEEVKFDNANVTSVDWRTYPILEMSQAPQQVDIVLIDHPEIAPSGAGEASSRPVPAAIANAVFDATGVRIRRAPLSPELRQVGAVVENNLSPPCGERSSEANG